MSINYPDGSGYGVYPYSSPHGSQQLAQLNVLDYWNPVDFNDAGLLFQRAFTAGANRFPAGFRLYCPPENYMFATGASLPNMDNVEVIGDGWGTRFYPSPLMSGYILTSPQAGGGVFRYGIRMADFFIDALNQTGVNGLDMQTTYHARMDHLRVRHCKGTGIYMDGSSGNTGAYNVINHCTITDGGAGVGIKTNFSEWLTVVGGLISFYNSAGGVGIQSGNLNCRFIGVGFDNNDTGLQLDFAGRNTVMGCQFDRGQTRFIYMHGTQYATITGNSFNTYNGTSGTGAIDVTDANNAGNVIADNTLRGGSGWTNFIYEHGTVGTPYNTYANNDTGGSAIVLVAGASAGHTVNNRGYNPRGASVTQLAVAATGTPLTNTTGCDCMLNIQGGTITQIAIGGTNTGLTAGWFRVPHGQTVTVTYTVAPTTFAWYGD